MSRLAMSLYRHIFRKLIILVLLGILFSACRITHRYKPPTLPEGNLYRDSINSGDTTNLAQLQWRELFKDTILQRLIAEGIAHNFDLQVAYTRIAQAEASFRQSRAAFWPTLNGNATFTESRLSEAQGFGIRTRATQYQIGVSTSWEIDVWGKLRSNRRANLANLLRSEAAARTVQSILVTSIATTYFQLLALDAQLKITEQTVHYWDTTVQTMRALKDAAVVTGAAVVQSEAQRYGAEVTIPDIKQRIRETENALSILLGTTPRSIERTTLDEQQTVDVLNTGIPFQLVAFRPDVQEAELSFRNAFELTNVARTQFYPSLTINGSAGYSSLSWAELFDPNSLAASIAAGLIQPIFNQRAVRTRYEIAHAQQREAFFNFQRIVITAGQEVSDAVSLHQRALEKIEIRKDQILSLQRSVQYSNELLQNGFANYTEVIQARQSLLQAELGSVNDQLQRLQATVELYRALGGGWR
ncbi:efflux transporter outer membrane subunit [Chryseosolibacter indicus]|uniref:Efflux transporter outer membrane subunit n=1 Tax=Chryseosolibacter indicus TaxID=2782351 RepID=A0ABS5VRG7_9BACT|nr:efflux transporter outer membrane subunit [Chryseosolibacter indicus]MBT1704040.1 efflux transporter outer membrane subunit [Chryseosolibacter indicus]